MTLTHRIGIAAFKGLTRLLCRIDDAQLAWVPDQGPLLVVTNHINILEIPIIYTHLQPRPVTGFVAAYRWDSPWLRWLLDMCGAIPLRRGEADVAALRSGIELLKAGYIVVISPCCQNRGSLRIAIKLRNPTPTKTPKRKQSMRRPRGQMASHRFEAELC